MQILAGMLSRAVLWTTAGAFRTEGPENGPRKGQTGRKRESGVHERSASIRNWLVCVYFNTNLAGTLERKEGRSSEATVGAGSKA